ncbi:MAG: hypothetical protein AAB518_04090 [Patescibacteria group bacterium]
MELRELPRTLFNLVAAVSAHNDGHMLVTDGVRYDCVRTLKPSALFDGAIGLAENTSATRFALWGRVPRGEDSIAEPLPILIVLVRDADKGPRREKILAEFPTGNGGLNLRSETTTFIALVLEAAHELAAIAEPSVTSLVEQHQEATSSPHG